MRVKKYIKKKVEKALSNSFKPVWVCKRGRFYYIRDIENAFVEIDKRYNNLAEIVEAYDLDV